MHLNTALAIVGLSGATALFGLGFHRWALFLGASVGGLGFCAFVEYMVGIELGERGIFLSAAQSNYIFGKMAPNSALCFTLSGGAVALVALGPKLRPLLTSTVLAVFVLCLATVTLVGHCLAIDASVSMGNYAAMLVPTAVAFATNASLLLWHCARVLRNYGGRRRRLAPLYATAILFFMSVSLWQFLLTQQGDQIGELSRDRANIAKEEIESRLNEISLAIARMANRTQYRGDQELLKIDATAYLDHIVELRRIAITTPTGRVIRAYPEATASEVLGFEQFSEPERREAFEAAARLGKPVRSRLVHLRSGTLGFVLPAPLMNRGKLQGFVYATVDAERLMGGIVSFGKFSVRVTEGNKPLFVRGYAYAELGDHWIARKAIQSDLANWVVELEPTLQIILAHQSQLPLVVILFGLTLSTVFGWFYQTVILSKEKSDELLEVERRYKIDKKTLVDRLEISLDAAHMAVWSIDLATNTVWRSETHDRLYGYAESQPDWNLEIVRRHIVPEDLIKVETFLQQGPTQPSAQFVFRIHRAGDGQLRWLSVHSKTVYGADSRPVSLIGIVRDITAERSKELERQRVLEWNNALVHAASYAIVSVDPQGTILSFNAEAEKMLGYRAKEVIGIHSPRLFHDPVELNELAERHRQETGETVAARFELLVRRTMRTGVPDEREWTFLRKDGTRFPVRLSINALRDEKGEVTGFLGIAADLTEKRRAEQSLQVTNERLARVIQATQEGIWERDMNDPDQFFIDEQGKKIFGFAPHEKVTYAAVAERTHPEDRDYVRQALEDHIAKRTDRLDVEFRIRIPQTGEVRWLHSKGRVTPGPNGSDQLVATFGDVTKRIEDRMALERALVEAKSATESKSAFLASMSHEIRTPLNGIIGMTDLLMGTPLSEEQYSFASIVKQSSATLLALINDVLDFSKIEAGKMELEKSTFVLADLVESQTEILLAKAKEKKLSLVSFISGSLPRSLEGDSARLAQVLLNLLSNAIKFTSEGGVTIRAEASRKLSFVPGQIWIRFEVEDTGIGIPEHAHLKIFQSFTQAEQSTSRRFGGTGLGLSISRRIVELMGGSIGFKTEQGKGSLFWVEVPLMLSANDEPRDVSAFQNTQVLVVHPDPIVRDVLHRYLQSWGMERGEAQDAADATRALRAAKQAGRPYQLVVYGPSTMPALGTVPANPFREHADLGSIPTILICDFGHRVSRSALWAEGYKHVVYKPFKQSSLLDALQSCSSEDAENRPSETPFAKSSKLLGQTRGRILVADDVTVNQILALRLLEALGYQVHTVANGFEVINALQNVKYDLVLMDCQMPEMDGYECARRIRAHTDASIASVPIIALTANALADDEKKCLEAGMNDYLVKPIRKETLRQKLDPWFQQTRKKAA